jgi:hypothetical protein
VVNKSWGHQGKMFLHRDHRRHGQGCDIEFVEARDLSSTDFNTRAAQHVIILKYCTSDTQSPILTRSQQNMAEKREKKTAIIVGKC